MTEGEGEGEKGSKEGEARRREGVRGNDGWIEYGETEWWA